MTRTREIGIAFGLFYSSVMIRPSCTIFIPIIIFLIIFRLLKKDNIKITKVLLFSIVLFSIFIPQLYYNIINYNDYNFLIHRHLYEEQTTWASNLMRYATVTIPGQIPSLFYYSPFTVPLGESIYNLLVNTPIEFFYIFTAHIFSLFDWGNVDSYIKDLYANSRIIGSFFLYSVWFFILIGLVSLKKNIPQNMKFMIHTLLLTVLLYVLFFSTTAVESRFGYPIYLFLLPFSGFGMKKIYEIGIKNNLSDRLIINKLKLSSIYCLFIIVIFYISFLFDLQTGRIDWFNHLKPLL